MPKIEIHDPITDFNVSAVDCSNYSIEVIDVLELNYRDFFERFMLKNLPCVIKNVTTTWDCTKKWIESGTINFEYFIKKYGDLEAPVADCDAINFNSHRKINMKIKEYMEYMKNSKRDKLLYLKDWHLQNIRPKDQFYKVPEVFASDWLNEFAIDRNEDDFRFVYIGPENSWTPLHADVYCSYSWSVNVVGRKKWTFLPPGEENKLKDSLGNLPLLFKSENFPDVKYFEIIQERGDALFVPSGWHHDVVNLLDTISINHNWVNSCNIETVWISLQQCLLSVENEIIELKDTADYISNCQIMLKSLFGMNYEDFVIFICYIGRKRLNILQGDDSEGLCDFELGKNHIKFDLKAIFKILNLIQKHPLYTKNILSKDKKCAFVNLKDDIIKIL